MTLFYENFAKQGKQESNFIITGKSIIINHITYLLTPAISQAILNNIDFSNVESNRVEIDIPDSYFHQLCIIE